MSKVCVVSCPNREPESSGAQFGPNQAIVICGRKELICKFAPEILQTTYPNLQVNVPVEQLLDNTSASDFNGAVKDTVLPLDSGLLHVSFLLLPSTCSRHNAPTRPDVVSARASDLVGSENSNESTLVNVAFILPDVENYEDRECALALGGALASGLQLYTRKSNSRSSEVSVFTSFFSSRTSSWEWDGENTQTSLQRIGFVMNSVREAAAMVDQPCNELHVGEFVKRAIAIVEELKNDPNVKGQVDIHKLVVGEELDQQGFGGIYGVGKAASNPPALVVLRYTPDSPQKTIVWVGKGIVYDTGGLSIKGKDFMPGMKRDMGGAGAILQAFHATCKIGAPHCIYAVLCLAENAVGPLATRPDDIHILYSGKSVEINNTDAEGRLVLGDGVAYATKHLAPDIVLDMCTLTGAQGISTGRRHGAIVCNDDVWEFKAIQAGKRSGNLLHPLPYCPEFFSVEFKSVVADMKNSVKNRNNAQSSCAGQFIASHLVDYSNTWIHVDMASPAHREEYGTGYGVLLLLQLFVLSPQ